MRRFENLIRPTMEAVKHQRWAENQFPQMIAECNLPNLRVWRAEVPIPARGRRVLLGVATWSAYDMRLMDALVEAMSAGQTGDDLIDVFRYADVFECELEEAVGRDLKGEVQQWLDQFIPGMRADDVMGPPVVGVWEDGRIQASAADYTGKELIIQRYGLSRERIAYGQASEARGAAKRVLRFFLSRFRPSRAFAARKR